MNKPAISITVAAYNVREWLPECLDSIARQSFSDFEVIVVDDCSRDSTPHIIDAYAKKDSRFRRVSHENNLGLSRARRTGLENCRGKYIWQIDGDDYIATDALEILYRTAECDGADIVRGRFLLDTNGVLSPSWSHNWGDVSVSNTCLADFHYLHSSPQAVVLNIFRRSFIDSLDLACIPLLDMGEDMIFNSYAFSRTEKISIVKDVVYYYRRHGESYTLMSDLSRRRYLEEAKAHVITFSHWHQFPNAQMSFMMNLTPFRLKQIKNVISCKPKAEAVEVIREYQKLYQKWEPFWIYQLLSQLDGLLNWTSDKNPEALRFAELMYCATPENIYTWIQ